MTLANNESGPERRFSWTRSVLLVAAVAIAYFLINVLFGFVPGEVWFRAATALLVGLVAALSWRYGWGKARWRSPRTRE